MYTFPSMGDTAMPKIKTPSYRRQKREGGDLAFVEIAGIRHYLGAYNTPESLNSYHRLVAEWIEGGRSRLPVTPPQEVTVIELVARFWEHAKAYYKKSDGTSSSELDVYKQALGHLKKLYGTTRVADFGPRALKAVRQAMVETGTLNRKTVNAYTSRLKHVFKWGVEQEIVPPSVWQALLAVAGLRRGRSVAKESDPVKPVPEPHIIAVQPHVSTEVWALIQLQLHTAARAGELVTMRSTQIDTSGPIWTYEPVDHKTAHHGHERVIYLGPKAQEVIAHFLVARPIGAHLFSATEAEKARNAKAPTHRRPDQAPSVPLTDRKVGDHYTTGSYRRAITRACMKAEVPPWHPHQLRHNAATRLRKEFGLDVARIILGHRSPAITDLYAELDREKALDAMRRSG
jgi:integrase